MNITTGENQEEKDAVIGKATIDLGTMAFPGSFQPRQALKLATKKDKEGAGILNVRNALYQITIFIRNRLLSTVNGRPRTARKLSRK